MLCVIIVPFFISHHHIMFCHRPVCFAPLKYVTSHIFCCFCCIVVVFLYICVCLSPPPDAPTTPPLHPIPPDPTALLGTHASDPTVTGNRGTVPPHASPKPLQHATVYSHFSLSSICPITSNLATSLPRQWSCLMWTHWDSEKWKNINWQTSWDKICLFWYCILSVCLLLSFYPL